MNMLPVHFFIMVVFVGIFHLRKSQVISTSALNGRYTKSIENFKLTVPHRLSPEGDFLSFSLPQHFAHNPSRNRRKRSLEDPDMVHYGVTINDQDYHVELWPNHDFVSPNIVFEDRDPSQRVKERKVRSLGDRKLCHYTGRVRDHPKSRAAITTCDGLAGFIMLNNVRYFIEPVEEHEPNAKGHHLHVVHEPTEEMKKYDRPTCGTSDNWEEAWKQSFRDKFRKEGKMEKRGTASEHRYLECIVVADKKFIDHHKNRDMELYIMTVMNMVSDLYHDGSSGNMMDVVVVRVMYLHKEEEEIDLEISPNAEDTLASFCKWQIKINPPVESPIHHDIAILLTRYDICSSDEGCGLMGLAYVATACSDEKHCAINEDGGMNLGIVVTHEVGHVMGCSHDRQGESTCEAQDPTDESFYVMAPFVHMYTTKWSTCSRGFITALFENGLGDCLNDEPEATQYKYKNVLPGVVYDAEEQCQMDFPGSSVCIINQNDFCSALLCKVSETSCSGKDEPPADGTKCGENKWCFHGKCVQIGERPEAINGGWGEWSAFSKCSRSCGGGISSATRDCNNPVPAHLGKYCLGERKKVKICNSTPCPSGSASFISVQCSEQNKEPLPGQTELHTWKPFEMEDEPCALYCINEKHTYAKIKPKAADGTPCKKGTKDMCVDGVCRKVGCDYQFDSEAVEDVCGICNGDGTQCKIVEDTYKDVGVDYKKIVTIPAGSRNIRIDELGQSMNTIAISDKTEKKFYLNGDHKAERPGEKEIGSSVGIYSFPEPGRESLVINGPLADDINFFITFYRPENVGYRYKYAEPSTDLGYTPHYQWELLEWSDCSVKCGGGEQTAKYDCVEDKAGKVSSNFCMGIEKPEASTKKCNEDPCKTKWKVGKWSKCHACKNRSGVRMREVVCVQEAARPGTEDTLVDDDKCKQPKPGSMELCESHSKCKSRDTSKQEEGGVAGDSIPSALMEDVWKQINRKERSGEDELDHLVDQINSNSKTCENGTEKGHNKTSNSSIHLNVGSFVKDRIPPEEIKLIRVPLMKSHKAMNLSDQAFESMGDSVEDVLDTGHAEIITGDKAAKVLKQMQHWHDNETETGAEETPKTKTTTAKSTDKGHKKGPVGHKHGKH